MLAGAVLTASPLAGQGIRWHGYTQLRYAHSDPADAFSVRRAKLWLNGPVPGNPRLSFKVQGIFRNVASGAFVLQDVFADYGGSRAKVRVGQFVPAFSLERSQPDYLLPIIERAAVVNALVPGARTMGRDLGAQLTLAPGNGRVHLSAGIFNGTGANRIAPEPGDYLATGRATFATPVGPGLDLSLGGSVALRNTSGTDVGVLSSEGADFAGQDFRWGADARLSGSRWALQGEYLHADLEGELSHGFYALGSVHVSPRDVLAASIQRLITPTDTTTSEPWYIADFSHLLTSRSDPFPTKIMADLRCQFPDSGPRVGAAIQFQVFFH